MLRVCGLHFPAVGGSHACYPVGHASTEVCVALVRMPVVRQRFTAPLAADRLVGGPAACTSSSPTDPPCSGWLFWLQV